MAPNPQSNHYNTLRRMLGYLGVLLPVLLLIGSYAEPKCGHTQPTISDYYYTHGISVFCGILAAIGLFLLTYQGHPNAKNNNKPDKISSRLAGLLAIGIALFPTSYVPDGSCTTALTPWWEHSHIIHLVCAVGCFATLAFIALCIFTIIDGDPTPEKLLRNVIYKSCGIAILVCMLASGIIMWLQYSGKLPQSATYVFWLESAMLWAFGISWLIKGDTLFANDSESYKKLPEILKPKQKQK